MLSIVRRKEYQVTEAGKICSASYTVIVNDKVLFSIKAPWLVLAVLNKFHTFKVPGSQ